MRRRRIRSGQLRWRLKARKKWSEQMAARREKGVTGTCLEREPAYCQTRARVKGREVRWEGQNGRGWMWRLRKIGRVGSRTGKKE